ncbi:DNA translocase FtsK [Bulleidia sp. zg-1006]|uniref:FtsK/SpoIIIE family DNA translocase n=1 Tax=Bulleidia sp. zg-1006 TaxID=2806552 RepID=UPI00193A063E|nr:DNA translocase FtsK [Bulleidia sp. zg-1006]QRG87121.1 DNA translocase FtsK [Bulleidia sp. zg-1006]
MARKSKAQQEKEFNEQITKVVLVLVLVVLLTVSIMKLGLVGLYLNHLLIYLFGTWYWMTLLLGILYFILSILIRKGSIQPKRIFPLILLMLATSLLATYLVTNDKLIGFSVFKQYLSLSKSFFSDFPLMKVGGGLIGYFLYGVLSTLFARLGSLLIFFLLVAISILVWTGTDVYKRALKTIYHFFELPEKEEEEEIEVEPKEPVNLWKMIDEHKSAKMKDIRVDEDPEITQDMDILTDYPNKTGFGITIDDTEELEPVYDEVYEEENFVPEPVQEEIEFEDMALKKPIANQNLDHYKLPSQSLLDAIGGKDKNFENIRAAKEKAQALMAILRNFDIDAQLLDTHIGPAVTQFEIRPDPNVKVSKILGLADNLKMQMAAKDIRIEAPIPGRNAVGVEIPNVKSTVVKMKELLRDQPEGNKPLIFFLGKDLLGNSVYCNLAKMPHLLIAGATGSGKSVCMNTIITSYLLRTRPDEVKLLLIDPKKVEFTPYQEIPHLIGPVINDPTKAANALKVMVEEMDQRYNIFANLGVRKLEDYNALVKKQSGLPNPDGTPALNPLPYVVVIVDELADLMTVAGKDVESSIMRITQLGRAAGIHMIVATQRPSVDVITGVIKANIPSRIAFSVSSAIDSRTILDHQGAERLLGNGDMLYLANGSNAIRRVQGIYVTDEEVQRITKACSNQAVPMYNDAFLRLDMVENGSDGTLMKMEEDPLFKEVTDYVIDAQKASTSLLQRRFGIGYNRAARMIDVLEDHGIIGPSRGSKPREVLRKKEAETNRTETGGIRE